MHAERVDEEFTHVGGTLAAEMDVVGSGERRALLDPLAHGSFAAHHAVHVPVGSAVLECDFAQELDGGQKAGVAFHLAVNLASHVGRADEQDVRIGIRGLDDLNLFGDEVLVVLDVALVDARDEVSAVFHDDELRVHCLERFGEEFLVHAAEYRTRAAAHGDVVYRDAERAVHGDGIDFSIAREVDLRVGCGVGELPREHAELVVFVVGRSRGVYELLLAFFLVRACVLDDGRLVGESHLQVPALAGKNADKPVTAHMCKLAFLVFALLDADDGATLQLAHLGERAVAVVVGAVFFGTEHDESSQVAVVPHAGRLRWDVQHRREHARSATAEFCL